MIEDLDLVEALSDAVRTPRASGLEWHGQEGLKGAMTEGLVLCSCHCDHRLQ